MCDPADYEAIEQQYLAAKEEYNRYNIIINAIENAPLDPELRAKTQDIIMYEKCRPLMDLKTDEMCSSDTLLGLTLPNKELNEADSGRLKEALQKELKHTYEHLYDEFYKLTGTRLEALPEQQPDVGLDSSEKHLADLRAKLQEQQVKYVQNLLEEQDVMESILKLRWELLPEVCNKKLKHCQVQNRMKQLQTRLCEERSRVAIFTEDKCSLKAYKELMKDIKQQHSDCLSDIEHLKELKRKYEEVDCAEYRELLKSYVEYKSHLAKQKLIYDTLHN